MDEKDSKYIKKPKSHTAAIAIAVIMVIMVAAVFLTVLLPRIKDDLPDESIGQRGTNYYKEVKMSELPGKDEYFIPDSDSRVLTKNDLKGFTKEELGFVRNEIFARHGYVFSSEKYNDYFGAKSWYTPDPSFTADMLTDTENKNIALIKELEK